jgi:hypothetical protein
MMYSLLSPAFVAAIIIMEFLLSNDDTPLLLWRRPICHNIKLCVWEPPTLSQASANLGVADVIC